MSNGHDAKPHPDTEFEEELWVHLENYRDEDGELSLLDSGVDAIVAIHQRSVNEAVTRARLVELDLLEQAINDERDMNTYKLQRLVALEAELKQRGQ